MTVPGIPKNYCPAKYRLSIQCRKNPESSSLLQKCEGRKLKHLAGIHQRTQSSPVVCVGYHYAAISEGYQKVWLKGHAPTLTLAPSVWLPLISTPCPLKRRSRKDRTPVDRSRSRMMCLHGYTGTSSVRLPWISTLLLFRTEMSSGLRTRCADTPSVRLPWIRTRFEEGLS